MSKDAATPSGAADGKQPAASTDESRRPILRPSRMEALDQIGRNRNKTFNAEQREAGSTEFVAEDGHELDVEARRAKAIAAGEDPEDVDQDDIDAEKERERLVREAEQADRAARAGKPASELDRQLAADDRETVIDDPAKVKVRIKVDGEERLVALSDLVRVGQKEAAADRRLEEAARTLKSAEEREAAAKRLLDEKATAEREAALKTAQEARLKARENLQATLKRHADLLYEGKAEEAAKLMQDLLEPVLERETATPAAASTVDVKAIKAEVKQELKTESALEAFAKDYPEIVADVALSTVADGFLAQAEKSGKHGPAAYKEAGENTRAYVRDLAKKLGMTEEGRQTTTGRESLRQRKETIDEPQAASSSISLKDGSPEPQGVRSVIAEMAANRPGARAAAEAARRNGGG